jgi:hypothetical protein
MFVGQSVGLVLESEWRSLSLPLDLESLRVTLYVSIVAPNLGSGQEL